MTPRGFYSAVAKPEDGDEFVTVRARAESDIRKLSDLIDAEPVTRRGHRLPLANPVPEDRLGPCCRDDG